MTFEQTVIDFVSDHDRDDRLLTSPDKGGSKEVESDIETKVDLFRNPFAEVLVWIRAELLDM